MLKYMAHKGEKTTKVIIMPPGSLDFDYVKYPLPRYNLGEPPWDEEELKKAFFRDWQYTQEAIKKHPGFTAHHNLLTLQLSLDIFIDSVEDLLKSIKTFNTESQSKKFWSRPAQNRFEKSELAIRRGVFASATSTMALVNHSNAITKDFTIPGYEERKNQDFKNNEEHRFIQCLRNYVSHYRMVETNWQINYSATGKCCQVLLRPETLLSGGKWDRLARSFIKNTKIIDVEVLFRNYRTRVESFHKWFHSQLEIAAEPEISEYRKYERMLNRFNAIALLNTISKEVATGRLDPYKYLDYCLTESEMDEVLSLPMRSKKQVDRIIEIVDESGACDKILRDAIYKAFGVGIS